MQATSKTDFTAFILFKEVEFKGLSGFVSFKRDKKVGNDDERTAGGVSKRSAKIDDDKVSSLLSLSSCFVFSRVLRDSIPRFVRPSVGWSPFTFSAFLSF